MLYTVHYNELQDVQIIRKDTKRYEMLTRIQIHQTHIVHTLQDSDKYIHNPPKNVYTRHIYQDTCVHTHTHARTHITQIRILLS